MMPVDEGKTSAVGTPSNSPSSRQTRWQAFIPDGPVAQFALPEFTITARTRPRLAANEVRPTTRGAATTRFFVNMAAAVVPWTSLDKRQIGTAAGFDAGAGG